MLQMLQRLYVGIGPLTTAGIGFGLVVSAASFATSGLGPATLLVSVLGSFVLALVEKMDKRIERLEGRVTVKQPPGAEALAEPFECPYFQTLAEEIHRAMLLGIESMRKPLREFFSEAEFFAFAETMLKGLGAGDLVKVACADTSQRWKESRFIKRWVVANFDAVEHGVVFVRFLVASGANGFDFALEQVQRGVQVFTVNPDDLDKMPPLCRIKRDMGIAVVNAEQVYFHWGYGHNFHGCFIESRVVAALMLDVFDRFEVHAQRIEPPSSSGPGGTGGEANNPRDGRLPH